MLQANERDSRPETDSRPVGFLRAKPGERGYRVVGHCCSKGVEHGAAVFHVNVWPYAQTCCECGSELVAPKTPAWPVLFNGT